MHQKYLLNRDFVQFHVSGSVAYMSDVNTCLYLQILQISFSNLNSLFTTFLFVMYRIILHNMPNFVTWSKQSHKRHTALAKVL